MQRQGALVICQRFGVALEPLEHDAAVIVGRRKSRLERDRLVVAVERLRNTASGLLRIAAVRIERNVIGSERERLVESRDCRLVPADHGQDPAVIVQAWRHSRVDRDRGAQVLFRLVEIAALRADDPEHMQRVEIPGIRRKDRPEKRFRARDYRRCGGPPMPRRLPP